MTLCHTIFMVFSTLNLNVGNINEYYVDYCESHITLLWKLNSVMQCYHKNVKSSLQTPK